MRRWIAGLVLGSFLAALAVPAEGVERTYSQYEQESFEKALKHVNGELEPNPENKRVESIEVVTLDVIEDRDPAPKFLNWFHWTSREGVIRREVLLRPGEEYDQGLVEQSERNLRVRQISVVLIRAIKGSTPDRVRLLVVTKDVWSLRMNTEPRFVNGKLDRLFLQPSEENLFGLHKIVNGTVQISRATYAAGLGYVDRRVAGSRILASMNASLVFNCQSDDVEGSFGSFRYEKPLYSQESRWAWSAAVGWAEGISRPRGSVGDSLCAGGQAALIDFAATPERDGIPFEYGSNSIAGTFSVTRSYGHRIKNDVTLGFEAQRFAFTEPDLSAYDPEVRRLFRNLVPTSDARMSPFVQLHSYEFRFHRVIDFETLALQEDYSLGHDVWLRLYPASDDLGSTRTLLGVSSGAGYTFPVGTGLFRAYGASRLELSEDVEDRLGNERAASYGQFTAGARFVTPRTALGRVVLDGYALRRYPNYLNSLSVLGGTDRLRGYQEAAVIGPDVVIANLELRSRPLQILSVQLGGVAFWDVGDAFDGFEQLELKHGVGFGLRFLAPQIDRSVFRIDAGFPVDPSVPGAEFTVIAQFYQAFPVPSLAALVP